LFGVLGAAFAARALLAPRARQAEVLTLTSVEDVLHLFRFANDLAGDPFALALASAALAAVARQGELHQSGRQGHGQHRSEIFHTHSPMDGGEFAALLFDSVP
jgi:hypothetical protein